MSTDAVDRPADAFACGALGCRRTDQLQRVERDGETRVLCPEHVRYFLDHERRDA